MTQNNTEKKAITVGAGIAPTPAAIIEKVLLHGDLSALTPEERLHYYKSVCESLGINPLTKPFDYIVLDRKLVLYARKDATEQLRKIHSVSITELKTEKIEDVFVVTASARDGKGRTDSATGAVSTEFTDDNGATHKIKGVALANAIMKAETKAKRRVTLSLCGLGMFDESELDTVVAPPSGDSSAILERNVKEATAHATGVDEPKPPVNGTFNANDYGPLNITEANYKELVSHVGKAQGRILGRKVGDMEPPVIEWMYNKWREGLSPSASEQDLRLKKAIEFAYKNLSSGAAGASDTHATTTPVASAQPEDKAAKQAVITDLKQRIEDLVLTEVQACEYLHNFGLFGQGWTNLDQAPLNLLLHLATPQGWKTFKELLDREVKPKVVEKPVKKGRKRAK